MSELADDRPWLGRRPARSALRPTRMRARFGLRLRSALLLVLILAAPALLMLQQAATQRAALVDAAEARVLEVAHQVVARDEALVDRARLLLTGFADLVGPADSGGDLCRRFEAPARREAAWLLSGAYLDPAGVPLCRFGARPDFPISDDTQRFLANTASSHGLQVDEIRPVTGAPLYVVALRVPRTDGSRFVLALSLNLDVLRDTRDAVDMLVLDRTGTVLMDTGAVPVGTRITAHPMLPRLMIEAEGTGSGTDASGADRLYAFAQLPASGAKFVVGIPRAVVLGGLEMATFRALLMFAAASAAAVLGFWLAAELTVFRWLDRLLRATRAVAAGDLESKVSLPRSAGEFALLARSFDAMTRRLAARGREIALQRRNQRESEQRFRDYAEVAGDWFWEIDPNHVIRYVTGRFDETAGVPASGFVGATNTEQLGALIAEGRLELRQAISGRQPFRDLVIKLAPPGEQERHWRLSGKPVTDHAGSFAGYRGTGTDITQEKRDEAALHQAKQAAEAANLAKSQFLANMSHELRTPLSAIIGFSEIIRDGLFGPLAEPRYQGYVTDIHHSAVHLLSIINDILDVSRVDTGQEMLTEDQFDTSRMIASAVRILQGKANAAGVDLRYGVSAAARVLFGDERRLRQAVLNIAGNAVKFTPSGGSVGISVDATASSIEIAVTDTGIGIAPADLAQVFRPFWQAETSLTRRRDGVGLGLTLTRQLVELHGGSLILESEPDQGTVATIRLPAWRCQEPLAAAPGMAVTAGA